MLIAEHFSYEEVAQALRHDGEGRLICLVRRGKATPGKVVGSLNRTGYIGLSFKEKTLLAHRVVWLLVHGVWPTGHLDHKNGCRTDNRPSNLRIVNCKQNSWNSKGCGAVPFKGVTLIKSGRYQVSCNRRYVGVYSTAEEAARAYDAAAIQAFGQYARINFPDGATP